MALWAVAAGAVLVAWAFWLEPSSLVVRRHTASTPRAGLQGLRIAVLADLHVGSPYNGVERLDEIVAQTNAEQPDLILLAGDYVIQGIVGGTFVPPERAFPKLAALRAPLGTYGVLGNHDQEFDARRVRKSLEKAGVKVLEDRATLIESGGRRFWIGGISDFREAPHDFERMLEDVLDDAPLIAFTHNPDVFADTPARIDLVIAGHTHGGQVKIPFDGRPVVPSIYGSRYAYGVIVEDGRRLFVTSGIGTSILPVRFLVPPEISILELK